MKRWASCLLAMMMVLSLAACSKQAADRYCTNCGHGLTKKVSFCDECGAAVGGTTQTSTDGADNTTTTSAENSTATTMTTTKSAITTTTKKPATTTSTTAKPTTTAKSHTHSYAKKVTPATCTVKGYTTYTCSCGHSYKDNYTNPSHKYENYVCKSCGAVDKAHAYEYLEGWIRRNGKTNGAYVSCIVWDEDTLFNLSYSEQYKNITISSLTDFGEDELSVYLSIESHYYAVSYNDYELNGYLNVEKYTSSSPISYKEYIGPEEELNGYIEYSRSSLEILISWFVEYLSKNQVGITAADLGFTSYQ